jgi:hypothetical protein
MQLVEPIEALNERLRDTFGIDTVSGIPIWRIVFSEDQYEWRYGTYSDITPSGIFLKEVTETRYVPKYKQWIENKYILERLVVVPEENRQELNGAKVSYEPIWTFEDKNGNYLPPKWEAAEFIIKLIYDAQYGTKNIKRYAEPTAEESIEQRAKEIDSITEQLWGDQAGFHDAIKTGEGILMPSNYKKVN